MYGIILKQLIETDFFGKKWNGPCLTSNLLQYTTQECNPDKAQDTG